MKKSARSASAEKARASRRVPADAGAATGSELDRVERWVQEVITHPDGVAAGADSPSSRALIAVTAKTLDKVILPSKNLSSAERMGIYATAYFLRLVDCLGKDFEGVRYVLGAERFNAFARGYVIAQPSTSYTLQTFGAKFPAYVKKNAPDPLLRNFLHEVATLEWTIQEVFDERQADALKVDDLLDVPRDAFPRARLRTIPALRVLEFKYPANTFLQAVLDEKKPGLPKPKPSWVAVYRRNYKVWRVRLDRERHALLSAIVSGKTLEEALELCASVPGADTKKIVSSAGEWFKDWAADGLFSKIEY